MAMRVMSPDLREGIPRRENETVSPYVLHGNSYEPDLLQKKADLW